MKILAVYLAPLLFLTSCLSTYPIYKKSPCEETTKVEKLETIKSSFNSLMNPNNLDINSEGISFNKNSLVFTDIRYVKVKTKTYLGLKKTNYWIMIRENNGDLNVIPIRDYDLMVKANNALMCLTGLQLNNGRSIPAQMETQTTPVKINDKYEQLEKLKKLLDDGTLTQEEFDKEKAKILNDKNN